MLLPYPTCARDWYVIWKKTKTLTITTVKGDVIYTPIYKLMINSIDNKNRIESLKLHIGGGKLIISFSEQFKNEGDNVVYTFLGRQPTEGKWYVPERVQKALREGKEYEHADQ